MSAYILVPIKNGLSRNILKGEYTSIFELDKDGKEKELKFKVIENATIGDKYLKVVPDMRS